MKVIEFWDSTRSEVLNKRFKIYQMNSLILNNKWGCWKVKVNITEKKINLKMKL